MKLFNKKQAVVATILLTLATTSVSATEIKSEPSFISWFKNVFMVRTSPEPGGDPK